MPIGRDHHWYLLKAAKYDPMAQYFKYIDPVQHIAYYQKYLLCHNQAFQMMRTNNQVPSAARNGKQAKIRLFHGSPDAGPKQKRNPSKAVKGSLFLNSRAQEG